MSLNKHALEHRADPRTEEVGSHEVDHAPVLDQVVLERVAGQDHAPPGPDVLQSLRGAGVAVLDAMTFVTNHHIRTGPGQSSLDTWRTTSSVPIHSGTL